MEPLTFTVEANKGPLSPEIQLELEAKVKALYAEVQKAQEQAELFKTLKKVANLGTDLHAFLNKHKAFVETNFSDYVFGHPDYFWGQADEASGASLAGVWLPSSMSC
jgi:hypothetical protein